MNSAHVVTVTEFFKELSKKTSGSKSTVASNLKSSTIISSLRVSTCLIAGFSNRVFYIWKTKKSKKWLRISSTRMKNIRISAKAKNLNLLIKLRHHTFRVSRRKKRSLSMTILSTKMSERSSSSMCPYSRKLKASSKYYLGCK